jgi:hypothetical protein
MSETNDHLDVTGKGTKISGKQLIAFSVAIILFMAVVIIAVVRINGFKQTQRQARNYNPFTDIINFKPEAQGGAITFTPNGGEYNKPVKVTLSFEPLKSSRGDVIDADIYFTNNGIEPTRERGMLYNPEETIAFSGEGQFILKARLISRMGKYEGPVYFQAYIIKPYIALPIKSQENTLPVESAAKESPGTVTNIQLLDFTTRDEIDRKTRSMWFMVEGIQRLEGELKVHLFISRLGSAEVRDISGYKVEPKDKGSELKTRLDRKIRNIGFSPPLSKENPVEVYIWIEFKNIGLCEENKICIER